MGCNEEAAKGCLVAGLGVAGETALGVKEVITVAGMNRMLSYV